MKVQYKLKGRKEVSFVSSDRRPIEIYPNSILVPSKFSSKINKNKFEYFRLEGFEVELEPKIVEDLPKELEVKTLDPLTMSIVVEPHSNASFKWFKGDKQIEDANKHFYTEKMLTGDAGDYTCEVTINEIKLKSKVCTVSVAQ